MQVDADVDMFSGSVSNMVRGLGVWVCLLLPGNVGLQLWSQLLRSWSSGSLQPPYQAFATDCALKKS